VDNQEMDVIGDRASLEQRSFLVFNNPTNERMELIPDIVGKNRLTVLCREDQMY